MTCFLVHFLAFSLIFAQIWAFFYMFCLQIFQAQSCANLFFIYLIMKVKIHEFFFQDWEIVKAMQERETP